MRFNQMTQIAMAARQGQTGASMESTAEAGGTILVATDEDDPGEPPPPPDAVVQHTGAFDSSASFHAGSEAFPPVVPEAHCGMFSKQMAAPEDRRPFLGNALQMTFKYEDRWITRSGAWDCMRST